MQSYVRSYAEQITLTKSLKDAVVLSQLRHNLWLTVWLTVRLTIVKLS